MNMVRHQAKADQQDRMQFEIFPQQVQVHLTVGVAVQDRLALPRCVTWVAQSTATTRANRPISVDPLEPLTARPRSASISFATN